MSDQPRSLGIATINLHYWHTANEGFAGRRLVREVVDSMRHLDALCLQEVQYQYRQEEDLSLDAKARVKLGLDGETAVVLICGRSVKVAREQILAGYGLPLGTKLFLYRYDGGETELLPQNRVYPPPDLDPLEFPEFREAPEGDEEPRPLSAAAQAALDAIVPNGAAYIAELQEEPTWGKKGQLIPGTLIYELAQELGMSYSAFMCAGDPTFGNCILSRLPIRSVRLWPLPYIGRGWWTGRSCICAELDTSSLPGGKACPSVFLTALHLDHRTEPSRLDQASEVVRQIRANGLLNKPLLIGGDFNAITLRDYTDYQYRANDSRRSRAGLPPARTDVMAFFADEGFLDTLWEDPKCPGTGKITPTTPYETRVDYLLCTAPLKGTIVQTFTRQMEYTDHAAYSCSIDLTRISPSG